MLETEVDTWKKNRFSYQEKTGYVIEKGYNKEVHVNIPGYKQ